MVLLTKIRVMVSLTRIRVMVSLTRIRVMVSLTRIRMMVSLTRISDGVADSGEGDDSDSVESDGGTHPEVAWCGQGPASCQRDACCMLLAWSSILPTSRLLLPAPSSVLPCPSCCRVS